MIFKWKNQIWNDNRGFSLVELLVAIAIGAVISGSIAALLTFSLRMYGKQTLDVELQQEIQTTSNMVIDAVMESDSFIVSKSKDSGNKERTDTVVLGKFSYSSNLSFTGYVFCTSNVDSSTYDGKLFMKRYSSKVLSTACEDSGKIVPGKVVEELSGGVAGQNENLLATSVQVFNISPTLESIGGNNYSNPFSVDLDLQFAKKTSGNEVKKELHDTIAIRNTLKPIKKTESAEMTPVCIKSTAGAWKEYYAPVQTSKGNADDELTTETQTVQMKRSLGNIESAGGTANGSYTVLEIIPNYAYDYMQYVIGGTNGELLNNYRYYGNSSFRPITSWEAQQNLNPWYVFPNGDDIKAIITPQNNSRYGTWINNETFKLFVLQDYLEQYAPNNMLDVRYGVWDESRGDYCQVNKNAIDSWHAAGNRVELYVSTPGDLQYHTDWIDKADMIVFGESDGGFTWASQIYAKAHPEWGTPGYVKWVTNGGDLSWECVKKIYDRIVEKKACIACPSSMNSDNIDTNINCLFYMLFMQQAKNVTKEEVAKETYKDHQDEKRRIQIEKTGRSYWDIYPGYQSAFADRITCVGSGRDVFRNANSRDDVKYIKQQFNYYTYTPSQCTMDLSAYCKLTEQTSSGWDEWNYKIYINQIKYNNTSDLLTFAKNGASGLMTLQFTSQSVQPSSKDLFGDITIVGAAYDDGGRQIPDGGWPWAIFGQGDTGRTFSEVGTYYQFDVVNLNNPVEVMDGSEKVEVNKAIYLNEYELERVKNNHVQNERGETHNLRVFCIVNSTSDMNTEISLKINGYDVPSPLHNDFKDELVSKYKVEDGLTIDGKEVHRTLECRCDVNIPTGVDTNVFDKYIKITADMEVNGKKATGRDYALIVVRDLFDMD